MNSFAPSFYYHDRVEEKAAELAPEEPELDVLTAVEPTPPPVKYVPVYSTYLHAGMAWNPAYNSLPEPKKEVEKKAEPLKAEPVKIELKFDEPKESKVIFQQQQVIEQIAPIQIKEEPPKEYKDSIYIGFQDNTTRAYSSAKKQVIFVEAPKSRFVQPIKIADLPLPKIKKSEEHSVKHFTAEPKSLQAKQIEGEAFHPVKMNAVSEYQFGQLNDLASYIDLKH